ncbi:DUF1254 domain-containing protein [Roseibium sp.]|uniref:DUF1254 domain-containing protein n=1 Tax=Roseibium sp. TaxID=1936156 RepID=UPI003BADB788
MKMNRRHLLTFSVSSLAFLAGSPAFTKTLLSDWTAGASGDVNMNPEYAASIARMAYVWAYPMVNMINRRATLTAVPEPGRAYGVLPAAPKNRIGMLSDYIDPGQNWIACPNQDVVYGLGFTTLNETSVVIQVPDFGDRFWVVAIYDQRTDQLGQLGRQYNTEPGHYMLVGPNWDGVRPEGITDVIQSDTELALVVPRIFMDDTDEDRVAVQPLVDQVMMYPLAEFTGEMMTTDWSEAPSFGEATTGGENNWVPPENFLAQLGDVLEMVPPFPGEEANYSQFEALLDVVERDDTVRAAVQSAIDELNTDMVPDFLRWERNGKDVGNNWHRNQNNAQWGVDYYNRIASSRSNKFENRPVETQYFYTDHDIDSTQLDGNNTYAVTFKAGELPPVRGFWSLTLYNKHHFFYPNDLGRYSLGTKNTTLQYGEDGSLTLYVGNTSPGADLESNWIPAPAEEFSIYLRAYWPEAAINNERWTPPEVNKIQ